MHNFPVFCVKAGQVGNSLERQMNFLLKRSWKKLLKKLDTLFDAVV